MKKASLVIGCSDVDCSEVSKYLQINREESTGQIWKVFSEKAILDLFIKEYDYHALCSTAWFEPIKNPVICYLLELTEKELKNPHVDGIIISGQFALDSEVRNAYQDILYEQGFEVEIIPVRTAWISLLQTCLKNNESIRKALKNWQLFNIQFNHQYVPLIANQDKTVIVSHEVISEKSLGYYELKMMIKTLHDLGYTLLVFDSNEQSKKIIHDFDVLGMTVKVLSRLHSKNHQSKSDSLLDLFWSQIANYYDVKMVIEYDAETAARWRAIGIPVISLTNPFDTEVLTCP